MAEWAEALGWRQFRALKARIQTPVGRAVASLAVAGGLAAFALLGPIADMGPSARITLALFAVAAVFWMTEIVPLFVTSLIILAVEVLFLVPALQGEGLTGTEAQFMSPFFSNVTLLFLGGLLLAAAGAKHRLDTWFAARLLGWAGTSAPRVLFAMMAASAFLSMWMSNTATTAMMLILAVALARSLPEGSREFRKALFLGVPFACNIGGLGTPIGTPPNAIAVSMLEARGESIGFLTWMGAALPLVIVLLLILWWMLLRAFPAPKEPIVLPGGDERLPDGWKPRATLAVFGVAVALWLTGGLTGLSSGQVALIIAVVLLSIGLLDGRDFRGISWDVLFLVGGGLSLGVAVEVSGLADWLSTHLALDQLGAPALLGLFIVGGAVITTFMSNTATANMLMPIALALPLAHGPLLAGIAMATSASMTLPVSTPPNAIAYYSGEVQLKEMIRHGAAISFIGMVLIFLAGVSLWSWLGIG